MISELFFLIHVYLSNGVPLSPPDQVLLFHDQNYGIHYEYTIPVNYSAENKSEPENQQDSLYIWTHSGWEGCSVQCGGGEAVGESWFGLEFLNVM